MPDLTLAIAHHFLVFGLAAMLTAELVLLRPGLSGQTALRIARLDAGYGATAGLVVVVGVLRVAFGAKGWAFYQANPFFWAKMASFGLVALLSIPPTLRFLRWRAALKADPALAIAENEVRATKRYLLAEGAVLLLVIAFAAAMARWPAL